MNQVANLGFAEWILEVGDGLLQEEFIAPIHIEHGQVFQGITERVVKEQMIKFVYTALMSRERMTKSEKVDYFRNRCIVTPLNINVKSINSKCLDKIPGSIVISRSVDSMADNDDGAIPEEVLNLLEFPGFPQPQLKIKIGMPMIFLRNLNLKDGLSNGTRLLIIGINTHVLRTIIIGGSQMGLEVLIPKIKLIHEADHNFPVSFTRYQFPVAPAFAMTINKAQGQTLNTVGIFLPRPVFAHGQLYVALSRASTVSNLCLGLVEEQSNNPGTINVVNKEVIR